MAADFKFRKIFSVLSNSVGWQVGIQYSPLFAGRCLFCGLCQLPLALPCLRVSFFRLNNSLLLDFSPLCLFKCLCQLPVALATNSPCHLIHHCMLNSVFLVTSPSSFVVVQERGYHNISGSCNVCTRRKNKPLQNIIHKILSNWRFPLRLEKISASFVLNGAPSQPTIGWALFLRLSRKVAWKSHKFCLHSFMWSSKSSR